MNPEGDSDEGGQSWVPWPSSCPGPNTQLSDFTSTRASVSLSAQRGRWQPRSQGPPHHHRRSWGSCNRCYTYSANAIRVLRLPEEVEVRAPHDPSARSWSIMPLWQLGGLALLFEGLDFKHLCAYSALRRPEQGNHCLAKSGADLPLPFTFPVWFFLFVLFFSIFSLNCSFLGHGYYCLNWE